MVEPIFTTKNKFGRWKESKRPNQVEGSRQCSQRPWKNNILRPYIIFFSHIAHLDIFSKITIFLRWNPFFSLRKIRHFFLVRKISFSFWFRNLSTCSEFLALYFGLDFFFFGRHLLRFLFCCAIALRPRRSPPIPL